MKKSLTPAARLALVADSAQPAIEAAMQEKNRKQLAAQIEHVRRLLEKAAVEGEYEFPTDLILAPETVSALRADGFKVSLSAGRHVVSWKNLKNKTATLKMKVKLTPKQRRLLEMIWNSEDHTKTKTNVFARAREKIWAAPVRGAFGAGATSVMRSLVKKGLAEASGEERGYAYCLTIDGALVLGKHV